MGSKKIICQKCGNEEGEEDYCPYDLDIWGKETICTCCKNCKQKCLWEI